MSVISNLGRRAARNSMDSFEQLVEAVRSCSPEQKQRLFSEIRDSILIHKLEETFSVRAEVILEAISRSPDLTQRGIRGLIAECVFVIEIIPTLQGWRNEPPVGDVSYDAHLRKGDRGVRVQVKTQRRKAGQPMMQDGAYIVEVQRTRGGLKNGVKTRPYRFGEFDLLAVCMWASTGDWRSFMYIPATGLVADKQDKSVIKTLQAVPDYKDGDHDVWTKSLSTALERVG